MIEISKASLPVQWAPFTDETYSLLPAEPQSRTNPYHYCYRVTIPIQDNNSSIFLGEICFIYNSSALDKITGGEDTYGYFVISDASGGLIYNSGDSAETAFPYVDKIHTDSNNVMLDVH